MSDLVGNPNCWFSHPVAHILHLKGPGAEMVAATLANSGCLLLSLFDVPVNNNYPFMIR